MLNLILTLGLMFVGVVTVPVADAGAASSTVPGYAVAAPAPHVFEAQQLPDVNIDIRADGGGNRWYQEPVWVAIGVLGLLLLVVLVVMASKGGGTSAAKT
jgi:hypothetical protein